MSNLVEHVANGNLEKFSETLKESLDSKRNESAETITENLKDVIFDENFDDEADTEFAVVGEEIDPECSCVWVDADTDEDDELNEVKRVVKINSKGQRRIKKLCGKGMKLVNGKCVKIRGGDKVTIRKAQKKRGKTLKSNSSIVRKRTRLTKKAMKKRKARGI